MKKNILIFLVILIVLVLILIIFLVSNYKKTTPSNLFPTPSPISAQNSQGNALPDKQTSAEEHKQGQQDFLVGNLINKLPYVGKNFSLYYDFQNTQFMLYINPNNKVLGNSEFDKFLKDNGVSDRSWVEYTGLFTTYVIPSPTPVP